jgi:hypothetical protein
MMSPLLLHEAKRLYGLDSVSRAKKAAAFFQDLPLFPQDPVLPPQPPQLLPLRGREPVATKPRVQLRLLHPRAQGPVGDPKLPGDLRDGPARAPDQPDCLLPEFPGVRGFAPRHRELLSEAVASSLSLSTKPGQVQRRTPPRPAPDDRAGGFRRRREVHREVPNWRRLKAVALVLQAR